MTKKVLFPIELSEENRCKREFLIDKFGRYVDLLNADFLEVGIGNGRFGYLLGEKVEHYFGIDIDKEYVDIAKTNIPEGAHVSYKLGSAEDIPFEREFDIIFYAQSWHFIEDFPRAFGEAGRVLKPNGIVAILEPSENSKNWVSSKLRKESLDFEERLYQQKLQALERGRRKILEQNLFKVVEDEYDRETTLYFYVLRK